MSNNITYKVYLDQLNKHVLNIECHILKPNTDGQTIYMPAWVPGSYLIRDFAKHVISITAWQSEKQIDLIKIEKNTWHCKPSNELLVIKYQVYGFDTAPRAAYIDNTRVFFNGARMFLAVSGEEEQNASVIIIKNQHTKNWQIVTSMNQVDSNLQNHYEYQAENYLDLIDHPFSIGKMLTFDFTIANVLHTIAITTDIEADWQRLVRDAQLICQGHVNFFGELPVMPRYVFILNTAGRGYGGIEHRSSCSLLCSRSDLPYKDMPEDNKDYQNLLGLISHEYFHLWNVKRIKPEVFVNPDLTKECYTRQLWIFEGITSYYDNLNLVRNNIITRQDYLKTLERDINYYLLSPGANTQTLYDSSYDAWIKFYQPDENSYNAAVSYYLKGALVALLLDVLIIKNSDGNQSLSDIMQVLWQQHGKIGIGLPEEHFKNICFEVTGEDYSEFFKYCLETTKPLDIAVNLSEIGVVVKKQTTLLLDCLGLKFINDATKLQIRTVFSDLPAEQAGLAPNDIIVAIDNLAVNINNFEILLKRYEGNNIVKLHVFRNDVLFETTMTIPKPSTRICELELSNNLSPQQTSYLEKWLSV